MVTPAIARFLHELLENRRGSVSTLHPTAQIARLVMPDINARNDIGRSANKPGVGRPVGCAGLAEQRQIQIAQPRCCAALHHAFQHVNHLECRALVKHLLSLKPEARHRLPVPLRHVAAFAAPLVGTPDHLAMAVLHIVDHCRLVHPPVVRQR